MILPVKTKIPGISHAFTVIFMLFLAVPIARGQTSDPPAQQTEPNEDSIVAPDPVDLYIAYLRSDYDDIHDVVMRYHLDNPLMRGQVVLQMIWKDGRLDSATVVDNDTGNEDFGPALIEAMQTWEIDGIKGPSEITIPIATRIVGSDNPEFGKRAILTGTVTDSAGNPLYRAKLRLIPGKSSEHDLITTHANREGVFIRTLIPAEVWNLECSRDGYITALKRNITFEPGKHTRIDFTLKAAESSQ